MRVLAFLTSNQVIPMLLVPGAHFGIHVCEGFLQENSFKCLFHSFSEHLSVSSKSRVFTWEMKCTYESEFSVTTDPRQALLKKLTLSNLLKRKKH